RQCPSLLLLAQTIASLSAGTTLTNGARPASPCRQRSPKRPQYIPDTSRNSLTRRRRNSLLLNPGLSLSLPSRALLLHCCSLSPPQFKEPRLTGCRQRLRGG